MNPQISKNHDANTPSQKELRELIKSIPDMRDRLMVRMLYETGCSIGELVSIKVSDVLGNHIRIAEESSMDRRSLISGKLAKDLKAYIEGNGLPCSSSIFTTRQSTSITERRARQIIEEICEKHFARKISPQQFRYFHIIHAYSNGVLIHSIAKQVGLTNHRAFQIIDATDISPAYNYSNFLVRV